MELFQSLLAQGIIPVVPPLGFDGDGKTYRVNSTMSRGARRIVKATKLIYITTSDGLFHQGQLIRQMPASDRPDSGRPESGSAETLSRDSRGGGLPGRHPAGAHHQRARGRGPAGEVFSNAKASAR